MSQSIETMKAFAMLGFNRLERATKDITDEQLDWRSCTEANTIRWILTHLSSELHAYIPKILKGDPSYKVEGWPEDYVGNTSYSLEKIMGDIQSGKEKLIKKLDKLTEEKLAEELDWFFGKQPKKQYMMLFISEILHHEGQIAAILGVEKRMKGT
ncbi:MAG: DinB family protein [Candidatus Bathyarchaeota archaeon]|nr:DinB family protein [Candidatus Bathyarchaeota archaeon]